MKRDRPRCATCGDPIARELLTDADVAAEHEYAARTLGGMRPFYCSHTCFRAARDGSSRANGEKARKSLARRLERADAADTGSSPPEVPEGEA